LSGTISRQQLPRFSVWCPASRVANLAFLKPDFEILAFFEHLWLFLEMKKARQNLAFSGFFSVGKAWLWENIV